jgi:hypothetical protein
MRYTDMIEFVKNEKNETITRNETNLQYLLSLLGIVHKFDLR